MLFIILTISNAFAGADPCSQISWGFNENIKRQWGNPKANARLVLKTLQDLVEDGQMKVERPGLGDSVIVEYPFELKLPQLCKKLLDQGIRRVWISCSARTQLNLDSETNGRGRNASDVTANVIGRCFIANPTKSNPTWDELKESAWGGTGIEQYYRIYGNRDPEDTYSGYGPRSYNDRDEAIKDPAVREELYKVSLRGLINRLADGEMPSS